jgi:glutathione S-transferase
MNPAIPSIAAPARLITIAVSHYCEKTRWALTRLQIPFVEERHMPDGRAYIVGDQFSAADLTFATLAAAVVVVVVFPTGYGVIMPELSELPAPMTANIQAFRKTLAGQFVLNLYEEHVSSVLV